MTLDPEQDEWMETETLPELQVDMPGAFDTLTDLAAAGVLDLNLGTVWDNWNETWSGTPQEVNRTNDRTLDLVNIMALVGLIQQQQLQLNNELN